MIAALSDEQIIQSNSLATVTRNWVIVRNSEGRSQTIISVPRITSVKRIKTTYPSFLVIAGGLLLIAAASFFSKDGGGAGIPASVVGGLSLIGYVLSRRASVAFTAGEESTETVNGSWSEAAALLNAIEKARMSLAEGVD